MAQAPSKFDPEREAHKSWLGLVQPVGLVVSPPALVKAQVVLDRNVIPIQQALQAVVVRPASRLDDADPVLLDFPRFAVEVLGWPAQDLQGGPDGPPLADALAVALPDYGETLRPTYAVTDAMAGGKLLLLVQVEERAVSLDKPPSDENRSGWPASPQARLERLLRDTGVSAGLLLNGQELRLVYAPRGESSGHMGFPIAEMCTVSGRPLLAALHMLLCEHRVFSAPDGQRLLDLLAVSRKYQSEVSTRLAEQVLSALWELLRGFQAADEAAGGRVLFDLPRSDPQQIYGGLLTVIMRLVFLLYAEDQGLLPDDPVYARSYAIGGLFERLRADEGRYPDTLDQRFGAYAWLLSTFRMIFDGGSHGGLHLPTRHGQLFNPDEYPFLEGRAPATLRVMGEPFEAPRVSDGVIWRVLKSLLVLDGERLSYRALDVEQVGSVYESMMGFDVRTLPGRALCVRPKNIVIDLDALLAVAPTKRAAWLKEQAECDLTGTAAQALKEAHTVEDVAAALGRKVAPQTPTPLPPGALFLQPGEERRRSGSHYTPRELTQPIVQTTLRPVLEALGPRPTPAQILDLKICDPAMGSGAFLVEACRQLAAALEAAWQAHGCMPKLPPDEDPRLHASRLVAQRCLYGVDKNRFAVNLAKLSLWLVTLAKDHAFTFLDHALKHGDSLVGLTKAQIGAFHWNPPEHDFGPLFQGIVTTVDVVSGFRQQIQALDEGDYDRRGLVWKEAEDVVQEVRLIGDLCIAAYFGADKDKDRDALRRHHLTLLNAWRAGGDRSEIDGLIEELRGGDRPVLPLHWEIEFPEVFNRKNPGFDAMVGNPPFFWGNRISRVFGESYRDWLLAIHEGANGNGDLAAHFLRRGFGLLMECGCLGLVTTNSISETDTRSTGLDFVTKCGGHIYSALRDQEWPGGASVRVAHVFVKRGSWDGVCILDNNPVTSIGSDLRERRSNWTAATLHERSSQSFKGVDFGGTGFLLTDAQKQAIINVSPTEESYIWPVLNASGFTASPDLLPTGHIINFTGHSLEEAEHAQECMKIVRGLVLPNRIQDKRKARRDRWWIYNEVCSGMYNAIAGMRRVLVCPAHTKYIVFGFCDPRIVFTNALNVFPIDDYASFSLLQSRSHEVWALHYCSTLESRTRYNPSDCFETFPFPNNWHQVAPSLESAGGAYYDFRAAFMTRHVHGLTDTYNSFHNPDEHRPDILKLRALHAAMDRAVLDAYGWTDIPTDCDFFLDYEIDEETWGDKKKPYRYRWPDAVRDEVLARLLDLNQRRYQEEVAAGLHGKLDKAAPAKKPAAKAPRKAGKSAVKPQAGAAETLALFPKSEGDKP